MDAKELKKILAGIGVVGLMAGGGISVPGSAGASGWGGEKPSAVGTETKVVPGSGWGGTKHDAGSVTKLVDEEKAKAGKVVGDVEAKTGEVLDDAKVKAEEAMDKAKSDIKKQPAGSGWSGTKHDAGSVEDAKKKGSQKSGWSG